MKKGLAVVISAPSGCGKTTLVKALLRKNKGKMVYSVSATTRGKRKGERNGKDYHFYSERKFKSEIRNRKFLEWAKVFGRYYGTPRKSVEVPLKKGKDVILEIDVQGAEQLMRKLKNAVFIFILPPSLGELKKRLQKRKTDSKKEIVKRLRGAKKEFSYFKKYDYFVVSRKVNESVKMVEKIIEVEKQKVNRNKEALHGLHLT